eukprot:NODE_374_length_1572_cov_128.215917_g342_i0.p1 GENE.NODE_374_length_1572_cov_128.215917_g342_i0~~NODE_374_length_1572_cov_128.215917_g342_i0.p1  ORF type:complete len:506 (+),score=66.45 NODE_374_length_1572_cov_128.215917_g342_i0:51-1568(+)
MMEQFPFGKNVWNPFSWVIRKARRIEDSFETRNPVYPIIALGAFTVVSVLSFFQILQMALDTATYNYVSIIVNANRFGFSLLTVYLLFQHESMQFTTLFLSLNSQLCLHLFKATVESGGLSSPIFPGLIIASLFPHMISLIVGLCSMVLMIPVILLVQLESEPITCSGWFCHPMTPVLSYVALSSAFMLGSIHRMVQTTKVSEQLLNLQGALMARTKLVNRVSHDLRTPLQSIIATSGLLKELVPAMETHTILDGLEANSRVLRDIVNEVLEFTKLSEGRSVVQNKQSNLFGLLTDAINAFRSVAQEKNLELFLVVDDSISPEWEWALFDDAKVRQVLTNMLSNAFKFTEKGYVKLQICKVDMESAVSMFEFSVEDSGVGMHEDFVQNQLFKPFVQATPSSIQEGSGLGLSIAKEIVHTLSNNNSTLSVISEPGLGSAFFFSIPLSLCPPPSGEPNLYDFIQHQSSLLKALVLYQNLGTNECDHGYNLLRLLNWFRLSYRPCTLR